MATMKVSSIIVCGFAGLVLSIAGPNKSANKIQQATQSEEQSPAQSDSPCSEDSTTPQPPTRLQSSAQDVAAGALPSYEYVTVTINPHDATKEAKNGKVHTLASSGTTCYGYRAMNVSIRFLMQESFGVDSEKIVGAPRWVDNDRFDVDIYLSAATIRALHKLDPARQPRAERAVLGPFLATRLHLMVHRDKINLPIYELVVGKKGPKFRESAQPNTSGAALTVDPDNRGGYVLTGRGARIDALIEPLQKVLQRTVVDKTGLTGYYDFILTYQQEPQHFTSMAQVKAANWDLATVYRHPVSEAVDKQLGLRLETSKGPVEAIVIDHIEKPGSN
jgi:uncharacterized protein (TIGR03435 family)